MLWFIAFIISLLSIQKANNRGSIILIFLILSVIVATSTDIADYEVYSGHYTSSDMYTLEPLYQAIIAFSNKIGFSFPLFHYLIFFSIFLSIIHITYKLQANVYFFLVGYLILLFPLQLTWLRMSLAFAIGYMGIYYYLIGGNKKKIIIFTVLPIFIHAGFVAVPLVLLLSSVKSKKLYYSLICCAIVMTFFTFLPFVEKGVNLIFPSEYADVLESRYSAEEITVSKIYRIICIVFCVLSSAYLLNKVRKMLIYYSGLFNISESYISIIQKIIKINFSTILLMPLSAIYDDFYRIQLYLFVLNIISFSYVFMIFNKKRGVLILYSFVQITTLFYLFIGRINFESVFLPIL